MKVTSTTICTVGGRSSFFWMPTSRGFKTPNIGISKTAGGSPTTRNWSGCHEGVHGTRYTRKNSGPSVKFVVKVALVVVVAMFAANGVHVVRFVEASMSKMRLFCDSQRRVRF